MKNQYLTAKFGFWVLTLADLELLDLELSQLTDKYYIDPINKIAKFNGNFKFIKLRASNFETINNEKTLYSEFVDTYNNTNAYSFHNLYPYKGKFYPRLVRTIINIFGLNEEHLIFDPFNGSGTTTLEASLMGINSFGFDISPMAYLISKLKNELLFINIDKLNISNKQLIEILEDYRQKKFYSNDEVLNNLLLLIYFDTIDVLNRNKKYNEEDIYNIFISKFNYIKECKIKLNEIKEKYNLVFSNSNILYKDILELQNDYEL